MLLDRTLEETSLPLLQTLVSLARTDDETRVVGLVRHYVDGDHEMDHDDSLDMALDHLETLVSIAHLSAVAVQLRTVLVVLRAEVRRAYASYT